MSCTVRRSHTHQPITFICQSCRHRGSAATVAWVICPIRMMVLGFLVGESQAGGGKEENPERCSWGAEKCCSGLFTSESGHNLHAGSPGSQWKLVDDRGKKQRHTDFAMADLQVKSPEPEPEPELCWQGWLLELASGWQGSLVSLARLAGWRKFFVLFCSFPSSLPSPSQIQKSQQQLHTSFPFYATHIPTTYYCVLCCRYLLFLFETRDPLFHFTYSH